MFANIDNHQDDPIEALFRRLAMDDSPAKVDLGIGVFRDDTGNAPVMQAVRQAELRLAQQERPKSYLSPLGNADYCRDVEKLAFGEDHPVLRDSRAVSAQTPGAGSALRAAAEFVLGLNRQASVWASIPVWGHQLDFFTAAGMGVRRYRYYDQQNMSQDFEGMLEDLASMQANDLLLLHGCCHNPTGQDLSAGQWQALAEVVNRTGAIPFIDVAYQGFGRGSDEDVEGLRLLARQVPQLLVTVSSSKTFGIYRERAGLLTVVLAPAAKNADSVRRRLRDTVRELYFMAPDHGAAVVHEILSTPALEELWRSELENIRQRLVGMREKLAGTLEAANPGFNASFLTAQHGMFSCLPISEAEQLLMEQQFHIYMLPHARVNVAAMSERQSQALADAFAFVRAERGAASRTALA